MPIELALGFNSGMGGGGVGWLADQERKIVVDICIVAVGQDC